MSLSSNIERTIIQFCIEKELPPSCVEELMHDLCDVCDLPLYTEDMDNILRVANELGNEMHTGSWGLKVMQFCDRW